MRRPVPCRPCANAASPRSASAQMMISCSWSSSFLSCGGSSAVQGQRTRSAAKIYKCSARSAHARARLRGHRETGNRPNSERRARKGRLRSAERTSSAERKIETMTENETTRSTQWTSAFSASPRLCVREKGSEARRFQNGRATSGRRTFRTSTRSVAAGGGDGDVVDCARYVLRACRELREVRKETT